MIKILSAIVCCNVSYCLVTDALAPYARVDPRTGRVCADPETGRCEWTDKVDNSVQNRRSSPPVWCGGDASCSTAESNSEESQTTVESANDGKTAAYHIHKYLQVIIIIYC